AAMRPLARLLAVSPLAMPVPLAAEPPSPSPFSERWPADQWAQAESGKAAPRAAGETRKDQPVAPQPAVATQQALYLIRSTLLTLNDANRSGNYTVLRDLAAPGFQAKNSPADLARIFTDLRERRFDLFAAALIAPQLAAPPRLDANGLLRLTGRFPTRPLEIH